MTEQPAFEQKARAVLAKPFADLPVAKDLPRLAKCIFILNRQGQVMRCNTSLRKTDDVYDYVEDILLTLTVMFYGEQKAEKVSFLLFFSFLTLLF